MPSLREKTNVKMELTCRNHEPFNDVVEASAFGVLIGFGWEFIFAFGGGIHHSGENDCAACGERTARPIPVERGRMPMCK